MSAKWRSLRDITVAGLAAAGALFVEWYCDLLWAYARYDVAGIVVVMFLLFRLRRRSSNIQK